MSSLTYIVLSVVLKTSWIKLFIGEYKRVMAIDADIFETDLNQCR